MHFIITIAKRYKIIPGIIFMLLSTNIYSQNIRAYSFGSIGNAGDIKNTFSGSIYFQSSACILITNGIKTFQESEDGNFTNYCEAIILKDELIPLTANPNPVSTNTFIKFKDVFLIEKEEALKAIRGFADFDRIEDEVSEWGGDFEEISLNFFSNDDESGYCLFSEAFGFKNTKKTMILLIDAQGNLKKTLTSKGI